MTAFLTYSTASTNILGHASTLDAARALSPDGEFLVILACPEAEAAKLNPWDRIRPDMPVAWHGDNPLAKAFAAKRPAWKGERR